MLQKLGQKVKWANEEHETAPIEENASEGKSEPKNGMSEKYRAAYSSVYNALPSWKQKVIDDKLYDDRIYKEFTKEVIRDAEAE